MNVTDAEIIEGVEDTPLVLALLGHYVDAMPVASGEPLSDGSPEQDAAYYGGLLIGFMMCLVGLAEADGEAPAEEWMVRTRKVLHQLADRERERRAGSGE